MAWREVREAVARPGPRIPTDQTKDAAMYELIRIDPVNNWAIEFAYVQADSACEAMAMRPDSWSRKVTQVVRCSR